VQDKKCAVLMKDNSTVYTPHPMIVRKSI